MGSILCSRSLSVLEFGAVVASAVARFAFCGFHESCQGFPDLTAPIAACRVKLQAFMAVFVADNKDSSSSSFPCSVLFEVVAPDFVKA